MVRTLSVLNNILAVVASGGILLGLASNADAQNQRTPKRTIIESLDDIVPDRGTPVYLQDNSEKALTDYDFSVSRELLPPVTGDGEVMAAAGWQTVVEARDIQTGSLPTDETPVRLWLVGLLIAAGSVFLFGRFLPARMGHALSGVSRPSVMNRFSFANVSERFSGLGSGFAKQFRSDPQNPKPKWNVETENAAYQMNALLTQIDAVVTRLKDGTPLRDVLNQELRLIHYRIEAATEAARMGHETSDKSAARFRGLVRELERVRRIADSAAASVMDPRDQLAQPQSPSEAYAMLGVNPDAAPHVLKKLVDALRVTWHPDHARNESDRLLREERIKQINSAWDLINSDGRV